MAGACSERVAVVTGASRGIGAAVARRLAAEGAAVAVNARTLDPEEARLPGSLREVAAAIEEDGGRALAVPADLTDADARARIIPVVEAELGPVDILVNNAAAAIYGPVGEMPLRRRRRLFELNVHAPVDLVQAVLPGMRRRRQGWIVNISSATSRREHGPPFPARALGTTTTMYGATKAALERFTTGLAAEMYEDSIAVNCVSPVAAVATPGAEVLIADLMRSKPELVEPVEYLTEAVLILSTCDPRTLTGRVLFSRPFLEELGRLPPGVGASS